MILPGSDPLPERVSIKARAAPRLTGTASQVVLVVEDEPSVRAVAVETLRGLGFATLEAADAAQAMLCLQGPERIDLLLLDGAKGLYPAVLALVEPHLRPGALIVADNADWSPEYLERVRSPAHGYMSVPFAGDVELSMRVG